MIEKLKDLRVRRKTAPHDPTKQTVRVRNSYRIRHRAVKTLEQSRSAVFCPNKLFPDRTWVRSGGSHRESTARRWMYPNSPERCTPCCPASSAPCRLVQ